MVLRIKDYGRGIPNEKLAAFNANATQAGVGLLSMRERVREQSGQLKINLHSSGTEIIARISNCGALRPKMRSALTEQLPTLSEELRCD